MPPRKPIEREWREFFEEGVRPRLEILVTLLLDTATIVLALVCRKWTLAAYEFGTTGHSVPWHLHALEFVLDYGLVATAVALVTFDLMKRVREGWRRMRDSNEATR